MTSPRVLVVTADDFGRTPGVNRGIVRAYEDGIVTGASLMVGWPAAEEAADYARRTPDLGVGLHLDLAEWEHVDGAWRAVYERVDPEDEAAVAVEVDRQLERFAQLVGRPPAHLDSHQHVHRTEPARSVVAHAGRSLGVVVRDLTPGVTYRGDFYGQDGRGHPAPDAITVDALVGLVRGLAPGITELGCHPGDPADLDSVYRTERTTEVEVLCHPTVREAIDREAISLASFASLPVGGRPVGPTSRARRTR